MESKVKYMLECIRIINIDVIDAAIEEIGVGVNIFNVLSKDDLEASFSPICYNETPLIHWQRIPSNLNKSSKRRNCTSKHV